MREIIRSHVRPKEALHQNTAHFDEMSNRSRAGSQSEESEHESRGKDSDGSDGEMSSDDLEDNGVYREWFDQAVEANHQSRTEKYEKYINDGMPGDRAREKAYQRGLCGRLKTIFSTTSEHSWNISYFSRKTIPTRMLCRM